MVSFEPGEIDEIALCHFGDAAAARCPDCGWELQLESDVVEGFGLQLNILCKVCNRSGDWQQPQPERSWKDVHLEYFREAFLADKSSRCPLDDCYVSYAEFENQKVQFICPYCNRRGLATI